jgi:quinol monooxygenase YgiN
MSRIGLITRITAAEGKRDELLAALQLVLDEVHKEPGTLVYTFNVDQQNPSLVWTYQMFESAEAFEDHRNNGPRRAALEKAVPLIAGNPELIRIEPFAGKGWPK